MENSGDKEKPVYKGIDEDDFLDKLRKNPWIVSTMVLGLLVLTLLFFSVRGAGIPGITGQVVSQGDAAEALVEFLNTNAPSEVTFVDVSVESGLYKVLVEYQGREIPVYMTKDGKYMASLQPLILLDTGETDEPAQEVVKSDKPVVDLFVMTFCPYGTQAEKGIIPTLKALGSSVDANIRFVHYFMHGDEEEQETYKQVCIRQEQPDKFLDYLECFLEDSDSDRCLAKAGIDKTKLNSCVSSGKAEEYYAEDSALSQQAGVSGSPTLVINRQIVSSSRSSSAYLDTICSAFNTIPDACTMQLSSSTPSPGFGSGTASSGTEAQC